MTINASQRPTPDTEAGGADSSGSTPTENDAGQPARRSVTLTLPSRVALLRTLVAVIVVGLVATVVIESIHIRHLSHAKSAASLAVLRAEAGDSAGGTSLDTTRASALAAATGYTEQFATYNYHHLSQDFAVTEGHAVQPFLAQYRKETAAIRPDLVKLKSISTGKVLSAGIVSVTSTTAVVDLFLDQTIVNSASAHPRVDRQRVQMSMTRTGATWQITKVTLP